jgi:hypothetical protein
MANRINNWIGLIIVVFGAVLGIYVGAWLLLIGGILQIAHGIQPFNATDIAWGVIRLLFSWVGWFIFFIFTAIGGAVAD